MDPKYILEDDYVIFELEMFFSYTYLQQALTPDFHDCWPKLDTAAAL